MFRRRPLFIRALFTTWQKAHLMSDFVIDTLIDITCYIHLDKGAAVIFFMVSEQTLTLNSVNILLGRIVSIRMTRAENIFCQNTKRERIIVRQGKTMPGQCFFLQ